MKKLICCLVCALLVAGCTTQSTPASGQNQSSGDNSASATVESSAVESSQQSENTRKQYPLPGIPITKDRYVTLIDNELAAKGYNKLSQYEQWEEPSEEYQMMCYTYEIDSGTSLSIFESETDGTILQLLFYFDYAAPDATVEGANSLGRIMAITFMGFEPDAIDRMEQELKIIDIEEGETLSSSGDNCRISNYKKDSIQMVSITAK